MKKIIAQIAVGVFLAGQAWAGFSDNGDGTVTDTRTALMWQKTDDNTTRTWEAALSYCKGLSQAGRADWRLPNITELESITDDSRSDPAIDTTAFSNTNSSDYWSSTTYAFDPTYAWAVSFYYGSVSSYNKPNPFYVRCVRGGQ